jgi:hypothetical protein
MDGSPRRHAIMIAETLGVDLLWSLPAHKFVDPGDQAVSIHQNLQEPEIDGYVLWDQNLCIVFDAHSPISLTGIDKIKHSSIIYIHIILCY